MSEMIERVARALYAAKYTGVRTRSYDDYAGMPLTGLGFIDEWHRQARAAFEAMREPTLEMQNACWREVERQGLPAEDTDIAPIFQTIIDAALSPCPKGKGNISTYTK